jgi:4-amino-4-deoxy-L-arabinose transferase-like glycosyltransferase
MAKKASLRRTELFALILIVLMAAFFRFYKLGLIPPGFHYDEALEALFALGILRGEGYPIYFASGFGIPPALIYLTAATFSIFGPSSLAMRAVSAVIGVATVPALYLLSRELFADESAPFSSLLSLVSAFVLAILYSHIHLSRVGIEPILIPLALVLLFYCLWYGFRTGSRWAFAGGGFFMGFGPYTYQIAWFIPVLVVLVLVGWGIVEKGFLRRYGSHLLLLFAVAAIVFAPLGYYFARNPGVLIHRPSQVAVIVGGKGSEHFLRTLWTNGVKGLAMFNLRGDQDPRNNLPGRPLLDPFLSLCFLCGVGLSVVRLRQPTYLLLLLWLGVMLLPTVLTEYAPHTRRALGVVPAVSVLAALGFSNLLRWVRSWAGLGKVPMRKGLGFLLALALGGGLLVSALVSYRDYFVVWGHSPQLFYALDESLVSLAEYVGCLPRDEKVYLSPIPATYPTIVFTLGEEGRLKSYDGRLCQVLPGHSEGATTYLVVVHEDGRSLALLQKYWPQGEVVREFYDREGKLHTVAYHVPPDSGMAVEPQHPLAVNLDDKVKLLGYDLKVEPYKPGQAIGLTLYWQALLPMENDYTVFTHLLGPYNPLTDGPLWGGQDSYPGGGTYPTTVWEAGEIVIDEYGIPIQDDAPPGEYQLEVGIYHLATMERLPVLDDSGAVRDDRILLGPVQLIGE